MPPVAPILIVWKSISASTDKYFERETMKQMKCPDCGTQSFYVKDPEDQYNISEFSLANGTIEYVAENGDEDPIEVFEETEIFCDQCAWHDKFRKLKQAG